MKKYVTKHFKKNYFLIKKKIINLKQFIRCLINKYLKKERFLKNGKLHIGCGNIRLSEFVNIDYRVTNATDISMNCVSLDYFPANSISTIFSNSFFEHLYTYERLPALKNYFKILKKDGMLIMLGIPDFEMIAKAYLSKKPGVFSKTFDTSEVYRLTHGDPEQAPTWWIQQLHKSIFDALTIEKLLKKAGFQTYTIFSNRYQDTKMNLSLGFVAVKMKTKFSLDRKWIQENIPRLCLGVDKKSIKLTITKN